MLISRDSPLRLVPPTVETRTVLFLDGIRYSIEILDVVFHRLEKTLAEISLLENGSVELAPKIVEAMSDVWVIVDSVNRLRELVQQLPGLKQNEPKVQLFLRFSERVESLRDFVQHFRSGIDDFVSKQMPLWGVLSWSRILKETGQPQCLTIIPGTVYPGLSGCSLIYDTEAKHFVGRMVLQAGDVEIDLAELFDRVAEFSAWLEGWCHNAFKTEGHHASDAVIKIAFSDEDPTVHSPAP